MPTGRLIYEEALVVTFSDRSDAFYGFSDRYPVDIIIDSLYGLDNLVGKWVKVPLDYRRRARGKVDIIDDKFPTRICHGQVEVKVKIHFDGYINQNKKMFHHEYFGDVGDIKSVLGDVRDGDEYYVWIVRHKDDRLNCRWQLSIEQDNIQKNVQEKLKSYEANNSSRFEKIEGIITAYSRINNFYLVWSDARPRSTICLNPRFCFSNTYMIGKWAEMEVDDVHRVQRPISFVRERYDTRVIADSAEILVVFQHIKRYQRDFEMFHTEYFGMISDSFLMVENLEEGAWYKGWIQYSQHREARTNWRLSSNQTVQGPYRTRPLYSSLFLEGYDNCDGGDRTSSPSFRHDGHQETTSHRRYPSPDSSRGHTEHHVERERFYDSDTTKGSDYVYVPSEIPFVEQREQQPSTSFLGGYMSQHTDRYSMEKVRSEEKREIRSDKYPSNGIEFVNTEVSIDSSNLLERGDAPKKVGNGYDQSLHFENKISPSDANRDVTDSTKMIIEETKQVQQLLSKISRLVNLFTNDDSVSISMKLWSLEEYEELKSLADTYIDKL